MKFYKDVSRCADIFVFPNGEKYLLSWADNATLKRFGKWSITQKVIKRYGYKIR